MQFNIENISGENLLVFASDVKLDGSKIINYIPNLPQILNDINKDNWVKSVNADKINNLIAKIKTGLTPLLNFVGVILDGDIKSVDNVWTLPGRLYTIGIVPALLKKLDIRGKITKVQEGITLNINSVDIKSKIATNQGSNIKLVLESGYKPVKKFTEMLKNVLQPYSSDDVGEPADMTVVAVIAYNIYRYVIDSGDHTTYDTGYVEGYNSAPLGAIIIFFVIVIFFIIGIALIAIWLVNIFKKNDVNVSVEGSSINNHIPNSTNPTIIKKSVNEYPTII